MIKVEGHKNLYRNDSGAIINTDSAEYNQYMKIKNKRISERSELQRLRNEIDEIKSMLRELTNKQLKSFLYKMAVYVNNLIVNAGTDFAQTFTIEDSSIFMF